MTILAFACTALPLHCRVKEPFYSAIMSHHSTLIKCQVKPDAVPHKAVKVMRLNVQLLLKKTAHFPLFLLFFCKSGISKHCVIGKYKNTNKLFR